MFMCNNFAEYVGIPFEDLGRSMHGADCFGLIQLFYKQEFNIFLPDVVGVYTSANKPDEVFQAVESYENVPLIVEAKAPIKDFDVLVFKLCGVETHVGMVTNAKKREMLHLFFGGQSAIERYDTFKWNKRLSRIFRHATNC